MNPINKSELSPEDRRFWEAVQTIEKLRDNIYRNLLKELVKESTEFQHRINNDERFRSIR